ncbi:uncharacterized protein [Temnothorax nylanderi]|uniref:uncharacterized protein isoform X2 n=1 Tax=Temnothorax nylanderi TaxID=102681 RepID=UPI003A83F4CA
MEEKQKTSKKNIKIMKQKLKKLGKAHNGKQQLEKFLSNRKCLNPLSDNDEDTTDHSTHEISPQPRPSNETQSKKCTKSSHNVPLSDNDEDPTDHSTHEISPQPRPSNETQSKKCTKSSHNVPLSDNDEDPTDHSTHEISPQPRPSNETQSKKCTKSSNNVEDLSLEDENDQSVMLQKKRQNLERTKISLPGRSRHSEDESDTENNESGNMLAKQSRIFENQEDDTNHNDNQRITESPRHRPRFRRNKVYRLKLQDAPYDSDEEAANEYDNSMRPDTRDVNPEEKQLYDIEGDEIYIGCGKMINLAFWEYMKHRGHWVFLRELLEIVWTREALVNRCFKTSRITTELENRPI